MKTWMYILSLASSLMLTACQEKVAPELTSGAAAAGGGTTTGSTSGGGGGGGTSTTVNTFTVQLIQTGTGVSPSDLNYTIHRANEAYDKTCVVEDVTDTPDTLPAARDIVCNVEMEEFAHYHNGLALRVQSDADTCDYMVHEPFSFWQWRPGITARQSGKARVMLKVVCDDASFQILGATALPTVGVGANTNTNYDTLTEACGKIFNITDTGVASESAGGLDIEMGNDPIDTPATDSLLCSFDYSNETPNPGPNCDEGQIKMYTLNIKAVDTDADNIVDSITYDPLTPTITPCGGNVRSCMGGPMPDIMDTDWTKLGRVSKYTQADFGNVTSEDYVLKSVHEKGLLTSAYSANFTRQCSGLANFDVDANFGLASGGYDPSVIADYVALGADTPATQEKDDNGFDVITLADDPFRGGLPSSVLSGGMSDPRYKYTTHFMSTNPFYTFICMDKAYDIKARIRVVAREWNRKFVKSTTDLSYISDVYADAGGTALMDATNVQNVSNGTWINYNDISDWDDLIIFKSQGVSSCTTSYMPDPNDVLFPASVSAARSRYWFLEDNL